MTHQRKKVSINTLRELKADEQRTVCLTAYDYPFALLADRAGVDVILVGDSLAMTTLGHTNTLPVTMDEMISHAKAVARAVKWAFLVGDMPYMSYQPSDRDAVLNAGRFIAEAGCDAVKLEGGRRVAPRVKAIVEAGIVVQGHLGLTPQALGQLGGFRVQGKTEENCQQLIDDAVALQEAGASFLLLEAMPPSAAAAVRDHLSIPVYGIGAGDCVDGQLVIIHDILGLFERFTPKFVKRYLDGGKLVLDALQQYCGEVRTGEFPAREHFYQIDSVGSTGCVDAKETQPRVSTFKPAHPGC